MGLRNLPHMECGTLELVVLFTQLLAKYLFLSLLECEIFMIEIDTLFCHHGAKFGFYWVSYTNSPLPTQS